MYEPLQKLGHGRSHLQSMAYDRQVFSSIKELLATAKARMLQP